MDIHHTVNPFLAVQNADSLIWSYTKFLGGKLMRRLPETSYPVIHAEVKIGDAVIGLTESLPAGNYVWMVTPDVDCLWHELEADAKGVWNITSQPKNTPDGESRIMHATDLSGTTWIFQQNLKPA
jgi:uncharacterized glyoxalase superfamily protein PhnB